jgi:hydroxymethylbilane synthase
LGLETRTDDHTVRQALKPLDDSSTHTAVLAERAMLAALQGGCLAPIAAWGRVDDDTLKLTGRVLSANGAERIETTLTAPPDEAPQLGREVAEDLINQGARQLIRTAREGC